MKKTLLFLTLSLFGFGVNAQVGSDDLPSVSEGETNSLMQNSPLHVQNRTVGIVSTTLPCGGGIDTLIASGACNYEWFTDSLGMNSVSTNDTLITGFISTDTTLYLTAYEASTDSVAPLPAQTTTFSGNVRGYYFTAPMDMVITGLYVPQTAGTGMQNVACLLFDNQTAPPAYPTVTNAFTNLGTWQSFPANDTIFVCFPINAGDVVGIYGTRDGINSYTTAPVTSMIGGTSVQFIRSGMQFNLATTPMQDVWTEAGGNISRTQMFYDVTPSASNMPVFIDVSNPSSGSQSVSICQGDSVMLEGSYQSNAGLYFDTLVNMEGCDSLLTTDLTVNPLPVVSIVSDTACVQDATVSLNGAPAGGAFSGPGVSGSNFNPATAGVGAHTITYAYTDGLGCSNSAMGTMLVQDCAAIGELSLEGLRVYPNPMKNELHIDLPAIYAQADIKMYDAAGKGLISDRIHSGIAVVNTSSLSEGMYIIEVSVDGKSNTYKLVKE